MVKLQDDCSDSLGKEAFNWFIVFTSRHVNQQYQRSLAHEILIVHLATDNEAGP